MDQFGQTHGTEQQPGQPQPPQQPPQQPPPGTGQGPQASQSSDERMWAMFCHLGGLAGHVFPLGNIIAPLVIWLIKKDEYPFVDDQGKQALNFQISISIYVLISVVLAFVLIGFVLLAAVGVLNLVCIILGAVKANKGEAYRYPLAIPFLK